MRLSEEQALQDDNRFANRNALAELKYCGWEIPQRKAITNDEIRFYAWLCRSAVALLKEQENLKQKMWNALYAEEDKLEKKFVGTEDDAWFFIYRPWLQRGFEIAIKVIAEQDGM